MESGPKWTLGVQSEYKKTNGLGPAQTACHCNSEQTELLNTDKLFDSESLSNRTLIEQGFLYLDDHETMERTLVLVGWVYASLLCDLKGGFPVLVG